jgi:putative holliday junction resolvase
MTSRLPPHGRLAGIDFGTVRVGVAVTDPDRVLASPLENYTRRGLPADAQHFQQLVKAERVVGLVVGLPVHASGQESQKSQEAREFGRWLAEVTGLPVEFYDERYSTAQAESLLRGAELTRQRRKQRLDMVAAQQLLAAYLEATRRGPPEPLEDGGPAPRAP